VSCFNSILVQLEATVSRMDGINEVVFQFHIGAIRRGGDPCAIRPARGGFNSILVQLEVLRTRDSRHQKRSFNSILVQLEVKSDNFTVSGVK